MSTKDTVALIAGGVLVVSLFGTAKSTRATGVDNVDTVSMGTSPLTNAGGTRPGLAPVTSGTDRAAARRLISRLRVKGRGPATGYARTRYGDNWADTASGVPYAGNGCRTRDDLLTRDGQDVRYRKGSRCEVVAMRLTDPYTGRSIEWRKSRAEEVQVDHVVPLAYAWRMAATRWPMSKRLNFANDPLNLLPVDGAANEQKDASGPAGWLPPRRRIRCAYVTRFAQVALKYGVPVTPADKQAMITQCR
ncbi:HNH endonuclease family protein [Nonomuraea sp. 3-1Str]|uniref:HNH endonuclease family protein n=1 Tax=Nonomuraea sp. 3-1Str TaxID=2929801 RepID=UPI0028643E63|nr:HNH endonuclease family protein [Nonomuraea sp. 3-1Str]MDR8410081.1 HNH endonuclease family protein [Nonomuraea sp. 3-1Str]